MADIDPAPSWAPIRQLETTDRNLAGPGGVLNTQPVSIAARLNLLRDNATALNSAVAGVSSRQDAADSNISSLESQVIDAASVASAAIPSPSPPVNNTSVYFNGSEWTGYTVTPVGRTLMAATTQTAQRSAIQAVGLVGSESIAGNKTLTGRLTLADGQNISTGGTLNWVTDSIISGRVVAESSGLMTVSGSGGSTGGVRLRPTSPTSATGQFLLNPDGSTLWSGNAPALLASRRSLGIPITISATAPASPVTNDIWLDISGSGVVAKKYNGTTWV